MKGVVGNLFFWGYVGLTAISAVAGVFSVALGASHKVVASELTAKITGNLSSLKNIKQV